jgi:hypothetical protein
MQQNECIKQAFIYINNFVEFYSFKKTGCYTSWLMVSDWALQCRVRIWVEPGSPFGSESQLGQDPLHRIRQGLMLPDQIWAKWFHTSFLGNPSGNPRCLDTSPHKGVWRKPSRWDSDTKLEDVGFSRWGIGCDSCWPPFVPLRPTLWLLWAALTRLMDFAFEPWALAEPMIIVGPTLDTVVVSRDA